LIACLALLGAGAAYGVTSLVVNAVRDPAVAADSSTPWLGLDVSSSPAGGAVVVDVTPHSPAATAGLHKGDVITQLGGQPVAQASDVASALAGRHPGDTVQLDFSRGQTAYMTQVILGTRPADNR
jgi:putative serine protease PepD